MRVTGLEYKNTLNHVKELHLEEYSRDVQEDSIFSLESSSQSCASSNVLRKKKCLRYMAG